MNMFKMPSSYSILYQTEQISVFQSTMSVFHKNRVTLLTLSSLLRIPVQFHNPSSHISILMYSYGIGKCMDWQVALNIQTHNAGHLCGLYYNEVSGSLLGAEQAMGSVTLFPRNQKCFILCVSKNA